MCEPCNHIITLCFCTVLSLFGGLFLHSCERGTVSNTPVNMPSESGRVVVESDFSGSAIFKNVCQINEKIVNLVLENMSVTTLNSMISGQNEEYDFMWKNTVLKSDDSIILHPLLNTDELSLFWDNCDNIDDFKSYITSFSYENNSNSEAYTIDDVLSGKGNCSISSILLGYWINRFCYENGLNRNANGDYISVFNTEKKPTISVLFVKYLNPDGVGHVYPIAVVGDDSDTSQYILDIAADHEVIITFLEHLSYMEEEYE